MSVTSQAAKPAGEAVGKAVALLTGGGDRPYVYGLATALAAGGAAIDLIGSDEVDFPEFHKLPNLRFLNLRGDSRHTASLPSKTLRIVAYYARLLFYVARSKPKIFHILWNNRFELFDRTLLMFYYRLFGKKIMLTAHNVNAARRDSNDTWLNRLTLRIQYHMADQIFVHNEKMKQELVDEFGVREARVSVIPLGINNAVPVTGLTREQARQRLGLQSTEKAILFFGRIKPYKGLDDLVAAFRLLRKRDACYRLIIAGAPDEFQNYWMEMKADIQDEIAQGQAIVKAEFIPDEETEIYFKAADVFALPYRHIYESGVLFLGFSFGLPVLAADVGSLKKEVVEGLNGFIFKSADPLDLANAIERYFASDLFADLASRRQSIRDDAGKKHSWAIVSRITLEAYSNCLRAGCEEQAVGNDTQSSSLQAKGQP